MPNRETPTAYPLAGQNWEHRFQEGWDEAKQSLEPRFLEFMEKYRDEIGPRILDVGSGTGRHLLPLAKMHYKVTGAELTEAGLKITKDKLAREKVDAVLVRADFHDLPFPDESYDTVVSTQAMQYNNWSGAKKSFAESARVLKSGGLFFLRVRSNKAAVQNKAQRIDDERGQTWIHERGAEKSRVIVHDYALDELQELAVANNLEIIDGPVDEKRAGNDFVILGQWNLVFRKKQNQRGE